MPPVRVGPDPAAGPISRAAQIVVGAASAITLLVFFKPTLLLSRTLATGGDMGSHHYVSKAARAFFPWALGGWATGWFAGLPMLEFYFPLPYLLIWMLEHVVGYDVAFKLVTVLGTFGLPVAAWLLFRLMEAPKAARAIAPAAAVAFLFTQGHGEYTGTRILDIFGGFITSTMAGEFAYSLGLTIALVALGLMFRATRRARPGAPLPWGLVAASAAVIGLAALSHMIPIMILALAAPALVAGATSRGRVWWAVGAVAGTLAFVLGLVWSVTGLGGVAPDARTPWMSLYGYGVLAAGLVGALVMLRWRRAVVVAASGAIGAALAAFWLLPAYGQRLYTAGGVWVNEYNAKWLWPDWLWLPALGLAGAVVVGVWKRQSGALVIAWLGAAAMAIFFVFPPGQVVNGRFLPLAYLMYFLGAAWFLGAVIDAVRWAYGWQPVRLIAVIVAAVMLATITLAQDEKAMGWISHNYSGYEAQAAYPEYRDLMDAIGALPPGRVAWEYNEDYSRFGTPRALENIPFFTDKDTMEGLLVESGPSAPFVFFTQNQYSSPGTGAVPGFAMPGFDPAAALGNLRRFGVRWFVAESDDVVQGFRELEGDGVRETGRSGRFVFFEIDGAQMVSIPENEPVFVDPRSATCRLMSGDSKAKSCDDWRQIAMQWMRTPGVKSTPVTFGDGTGEGSGGTAIRALARVDDVDQILDTPQRAVGDLPQPTDVEVDRTRISFHTEAIGAPHLIATSYFPNWRAEGAEGPYLVTPSLMLVFPTQEDVTLVYGTSDIERAGQAVTLMGLLALVACVFFSPTSRRRRNRRRGANGVVVDEPEPEPAA